MHWQDQEVKDDPKIREYMEWLKPRLHEIHVEEEFAEAKRKDPNSYQQRVEVTAKGQTFKRTATHPKGGWYSKALRNTDEELVAKFVENACRVLPKDKATRVAEAILDLNKMGNIVEMVKMVAP
jgi:hypothetical protein